MELCIACGDMMYLLRKYDVAPVGRSDVMFAKSIRRSQHHSQSEHH